jgi:hypothetical protein
LCQYSPPLAISSKKHKLREEQDAMHENQN